MRWGVIAVVAIVGIGAGTWAWRWKGRRVPAATETASATSVATSAEEARPEVRVRVALGTAKRVAAVVAGHVREGLVRRGEGDAVEPGAATTWDRVNERAYRFQLRAGIEWSDGTRLVAADFVRGLQARHIPASIVAMVAEGDDVVVVTFGGDGEPDLRVLATAATTPLAEASEGKDDQETAPPFNGPFVADGASLLRRNPRYWSQQVVGLDVIELDAARVRAASLAASGVALADPVAIDPAARTEEEKLVQRVPTGEVVVLAVDKRNAALRNAALRAGLRSAINREDLVDNAAEPGTLLPMRGLVPVAAPLIYETSPRAAEVFFKKARHELGAKFPKKLTVAARDDEASRRELAHLQGWMQRNHQLVWDVKVGAKDADLYYLRMKPRGSDADAYLKMYEEDPLLSRLDVADIDMLIGIAQGTSAAFVDPRLKGVVRRFDGVDPDLTRARWEP